MQCLHNPWAALLAVSQRHHTNFALSAPAADAFDIGTQPSCFGGSVLTTVMHTHAIPDMTNMLTGGNWDPFNTSAWSLELGRLTF